MTNLITSLIDIVAPFVRKPRLVVALLIVVIAVGPNVAQAQTATQNTTETYLAMAAEKILGPEKPQTMQETLLDICQERGYGEECAKTLLGMAWKESNFKGNAIGDQGRARGFFQIWYKLHNISIDCAEDLRCSADWTIDYLESNSYPKYPMYAVQCHNGCNIENGYAASVKRHGLRLWSKTVTLALAETK